MVKRQMQAASSWRTASASVAVPQARLNLSIGSPIPRLNIRSYKVIHDLNVEERLR